jgi:hypothetical protein
MPPASIEAVELIEGVLFTADERETMARDGDSSEAPPRQGVVHTEMAARLLASTWGDPTATSGNKWKRMQSYFVRPFRPPFLDCLLPHFQPASVQMAAIARQIPTGLRPER